MLEADHQFRRVNGHLRLPKLRAALEAHFKNVGTESQNRTRKRHDDHGAATEVQRNSGQPRRRLLELLMAGPSTFYIEISNQLSLPVDSIWPPGAIAGQVAHTVAGLPEPRSTAHIGIRLGASTRKVPSGLGRWELLKLPSSG
jgi:hypothetical protein